MPGDPLLVRLEMLEPGKRMLPEDIARMREMYGLNDPWYISYAKWLGNLFRGDLGQSFTQHASVASVISRRIGPTLLLTLSSLILSYLLAIPLGLYATARNGRWDERTVSILLYMLYSLPSFVAALGLASAIRDQTQRHDFRTSPFRHDERPLCATELRRKNSLTCSATPFCQCSASRMARWPTIAASFLPTCKR